MLTLPESLTPRMVRMLRDHWVGKVIGFCQSQDLVWFLGIDAMIVSTALGQPLPPETITYADGSETFLFQTTQQALDHVLVPRLSKRGIDVVIIERVDAS